MTAPAWMPLYVADYLADTSHLSTIEHGAYLLLIMHYWQNGGLPVDDGKLARICRLSRKEWVAIRPTISDFFDADWVHHRVATELTTASETISKRSAAGKAGASARYGNRNERGEANADQTDAPSPTPSPKKGSEPNGSGAGGAPSVSKFIYEKGKQLLALDPKKPKDPGAIVSKWLRDFGDDAVLAAFRACEAKQTPEPIRFITATLQKRSGNNAEDDLLYRGVI